LDSTEFQSNDTFTGGRLQVSTVLDEQAPFLLDGSREYSLREHPVLTRTSD